MSHEHNQLADAIRQQLRLAMNDLMLPRVCPISSYDGKGSVKVTVRSDPGSEPIESNWMPLGCIAVGSGWGVMAGPQLGDQVMVAFEGGDVNSGVVIARLYSALAPAMPVPSGEIWAVHETGSSLKFVTSGDVDVNAAANLNASVAGNLVATAAGNATVTATGSATIKAASAVVQAASIALQNSGASLLKLLNSAFSTWAANHVHSNGNGGADTGGPTTSPPAAGQTSVVSAE